MTIHQLGSPVCLHQSEHTLVSIHLENFHSNTSYQDPQNEVHDLNSWSHIQV